MLATLVSQDLPLFETLADASGWCAEAATAARHALAARPQLLARLGLAKGG